MRHGPGRWMTGGNMFASTLHPSALLSGASSTAPPEPGGSHSARRQLTPCRPFGCRTCLGHLRSGTLSRPVWLFQGCGRLWLAMQQLWRVTKLQGKLLGPFCPYHESLPFGHIFVPYMPACVIKNVKRAYECVEACRAPPTRLAAALHFATSDPHTLAWERA